MENFNNKLNNIKSMEYVIRKDVVGILRKAIQDVEKEDISALSELSDHAIHDASIFQDKDSIKIAVVIYALSKIIPRSEGRTDEWDKAKKEVVKDLEEGRFYLEKIKKK